MNKTWYSQGVQIKFYGDVTIARRQERDILAAVEKTRMTMGRKNLQIQTLNCSYKTGSLHKNYLYDIRHIGLEP